MLRRFLNLTPILAAAALMVLPMKAWAFDWDHEGTPGTVQALPGHPGLGLACDSDGDDCHTVRLPGYSGGYGGGYSGYSQPYGYQANYGNSGYGYGGGYGYTGNSLIDARASAQAQYNAAVARGDRNGAKHLVNAMRSYDKQLAATNAQASYGANYNPYYNQGYADPGYNNYQQPYGSYGASAGLNANTTATVLLPMLQTYLGF